MGLSLSLFYSAWEEIIRHSFFGLAHNISFSPQRGGVPLRINSFNKTDAESVKNAVQSNSRGRKNSINLKKCKPENILLERNLSFTDLVQDKGSLVKESFNGGKDGRKPMPALSLPEPAILFSPRPVSELDNAAIKLQKVYKSYRTRRNLADCAVLVEELWWKALDFAALKRSSVSFFNVEKPETAVSRWARARTRAAKVGKGLSKDEKAQKLALQHWLEAIDPRHRYGHNLHMFYDLWFESQSSQPFFYWLDVGDGKEVNLEKCSRTVLQQQCIQYLGPKERQAYEAIVENGKLVYKQSGMLLDTVEGSKWIFVLSTTRALYVGQKKKGMFQHSSFLAGGATSAAGRLVAHGGILEAIWPYSGHYRPTEENFRELISFLQDNHVDLTDVKTHAIDDDCPPVIKAAEEEQKSESILGSAHVSQLNDANATDKEDTTKESAITNANKEQNADTNNANVEGPVFDLADAKNANVEEPVFDLAKTNNANVEEPVFDLAKPLPCKWATGAGPRIGCVRDYPAELQSRALEQVNLSPRVAPGTLCKYGPVPSPRPSPKVRVSPRLAYMGLPSPRTPIAQATN